jgi:hypothetical protein
MRELASPQTASSPAHLLVSPRLCTRTSDKDGIPAILYLRKEHDVGAKRLGSSTELFTLCHAGWPVIATGRRLHKLNLDLHCKDLPILGDCLEY